MAQAVANGIRIEYEDKGARDAPVILLIMGLGAQLTLWPDELADPLVPLAGGEDTAASIAGARLMTIPGMGHDLPLGLVDTLVDAIAAHAGAVAAMPVAA